MNIRNTAAISSIVLGVLLVIGGAATWLVVSDTLAEQRIVTPDDACLPGRTVNGPLTAYCQAEIIQEHTLEATEGRTYAELDREDPLRETAMNSAFLQASLFTSIVLRDRRDGHRDGHHLHPHRTRNPGRQQADSAAGLSVTHDRHHGLAVLDATRAWRPTRSSSGTSA